MRRPPSTVSRPTPCSTACSPRLPQKPHVVVSGINQGQNLGNVTELSGTVGAARTANRLGIPAIAVSQGFGRNDGTTRLAIVTTPLGRRAAPDTCWPGTPNAQTLNINVPTCAAGSVRGAALRAARPHVGHRELHAAVGFDRQRHVHAEPRDEEPDRRRRTAPRPRPASRTTSTRSTTASSRSRRSNPDFERSLTRSMVQVVPLRRDLHHVGESGRLVLADVAVLEDAPAGLTVERRARDVVDDRERAAARDGRDRCGRRPILRSSRRPSTSRASSRGRRRSRSRR